MLGRDTTTAWWPLRNIRGNACSISSKECRSVPKGVSAFILTGASINRSSQEVGAAQLPVMDKRINRTRR